MRTWILRGFLALSYVLLGGCAGNLPWEHIPRQDTHPAAAPLPPVSVEPGLRVAVVLPMTGGNAPLSRALLNAAILANYDIHNHDITLVPMDQTAVLKNPQSLTEKHINVTIGPLTAGATRSLQPFARQNDIRLFSLSNNPSLPDDNTVVFGYRVETEVSRILDYVYAQGKSHILAVVPRDAYGDAVAAVLQLTPATQLQIIRFGKPDELSAALKTISGTPDAVFIPVSGAALAPTLKALADAGLPHDKAQYFSTGLWDDAAIWKVPELDGAWYPAADPAQLQLYLGRYRAQFGAEPPRLTALSYNAFAMIAILQKQNPQNPFAPSQLNNPSGFNGVDGLFRVMPDGSVRRALAVVSIENRGPRVIQAAPDSNALAN